MFSFVKGSGGIPPQFAVKKTIGHKIEMNFIFLLVVRVVLVFESSICFIIPFSLSQQYIIIIFWDFRLFGQGMTEDRHVLAQTCSGPI